MGTHCFFCRLSRLCKDTAIPFEVTHPSAFKRAGEAQRYIGTEILLRTILFRSCTSGQCLPGTRRDCKELLRFRGRGGLKQAIPLQEA